MTLKLLLNAPLMSPGIKKNLVLDGTTPVAATESVSADVFFRWEDEPEMEPQYLGSGVAGQDLVVPFDLKGRAIRLHTVARTKDGRTSVTDIRAAEQKVFTPGGVAVLAGLVFATGTVTGTIANNGGTGTIRVLRRTGTDPFVEITNVTPATTIFTDSPPIDAAYDYELTQDGQEGASNVRSVIVSGVSGTTGTAPDALAGDWDGSFSVPLTWTNHGGTGSIILERKDGFGPYRETATLTSSDTSCSDPVSPGSINITYSYRLRNTSTTGYSNTLDVFVPAA